MIATSSTVEADKVLYVCIIHSHTEMEEKPQTVTSSFVCVWCRNV